jgi:hypothetical protein
MEQFVSFNSYRGEPVASAPITDKKEDKKEHWLVRKTRERREQNK